MYTAFLRAEAAAEPVHCPNGVNGATDEEDMADEALKSIKVIFVIGGPGSGKGTQCENILKDYNVGHVSTGDLMRAEVESGSDLGKELKATMEKGELVTLDTVLRLLKASLVKMSADKKCFLIDGFPREKEQGVRFENEVTECACCLFFDVEQEVMVQRLLKRGETSGRVDDNEETIRKRLKTFVDNTDPILHYFEEKKKLEKIVAAGTIDEIYGHVKAALDKAHIEKK